ncbi:MAG TPA: hypothetical protein VI875_01405 [Candidatus Norongarragalinales archaeon]|nr:hypothetical protein [Candidatus Norongarragalinales archaeon]
MPGKRYSEESLSAAIKKQIASKTNLVVRTLRKNNPAAYRLYAAVRYRRVNGKPFKGYGSWLAYLQAEHDFSRTSNQKLKVWKFKDEDVHQMIAEQVVNGVNLSSDYWQGSNEAVNDAGLSLSSLIRLAHYRKGEGGLSYFGHGTWEKYLREHPEVDFVPYVITDKQLHNIITLLLSKGIGTDSSYWQNNTQSIDLEPLGLKSSRNGLPGISLSALRGMVSRRKGKNGKNFFGTGRWSNYLKVFHKTSVRPYVFLQDDRLHSIVENQVSEGTPLRAVFWEGRGEIAAEGYTRGSIYQMARNRQGKNKKSFFGYGSWKDYLQEHHGIAVWPKRGSPKPKPKTQLGGRDSASKLAMSKDRAAS